MIENPLLETIQWEEWMPSLSGVLSMLSLASGPVLLALMLAFYTARRGRPLPPPLLPAIPLALTSISLQLLVAALMIIRGFAAIGEAGAGGIGSIAVVFLDTRVSLLRRVIEVGACVVLVATYQFVVWVRPVSSDEDGRRGSPYGMLGWPAAAVLALGMLWLLYDRTIDFTMMTVDQARAAEAETRLAGLTLEDVSNRVATALMLLATIAFGLTYALVAIGIICLSPKRLEHNDVRASMALALAVLATCGAGSAWINGQNQYLRGFADSARAVSAPLGDPPPGDVDRPGDVGNFEFLAPPPRPPLPPVEFWGVPPPPPPPPPPSP